MTKEEHMARLEIIKNYLCAKKDIESMIYAIETLKQEPKIFYDKGYADGMRALATHIEFCREEQEPKTVLYSGDGYADGCMVFDMAECPNCGYEYEDGDKDWGENFCPHCGQPLKWESEG